jgi:hypothetical protein
MANPLVTSPLSLVALALLLVTLANPLVTLPLLSATLANPLMTLAVLLNDSSYFPIKI